MRNSSCPLSSPDQEVLGAEEDVGSKARQNTPLALIFRGSGPPQRATGRGAGLPVVSGESELGLHLRSSLSGAACRGGVEGLPLSSVYVCPSQTSLLFPGSWRREF